MTTTGENARPLPLIGQSAAQAQAADAYERDLSDWLRLDGQEAATLDRGDLEITIRTLDEITRRVRETFVTEGS